MIKYLTILGVLSIGLLAGCQQDTPVTKYSGQIVSMDSDDAEVVYQTNDGKFHNSTYQFDEGGQVSYFHIGQKIVCYVRDDGYVKEIATK